MATDRLSDEQLLKQFQQVEKLPEDDKAVIKKVLNAFLLQQKMQEMIAG